MKRSRQGPIPTGSRSALAACLALLAPGCADVRDGTGVDVPLDVEGEWRATSYVFEARSGDERMDLVAQTGLSLRLSIAADGALAGTARLNDPDAGLVDVPFTGRRTSGGGSAAAVTVDPRLGLAGGTLLAGPVRETYGGSTLTWRYDDVRWDFDLDGPRAPESATATLVLTRVF